MFDRFTQDAIKVIMLSQEEARRIGHCRVGTEQILLGLIRQNEGIAAEKLKQAGVSLKSARIEVERMIGRGPGNLTVEIPFTLHAKRLLQLSWDEACRLKHDYISPDHLLLGTLRVGEGIACTVLKALNVDLPKLYSEVNQAIGGSASDLFTDSSTKPCTTLFPTNSASLFNAASQMEEPFNRYSPDAILTMQRAWGIAETFGSNEIGIEHLFLAVLRDDASVLNALRSAGLNLGQIRRPVFKNIMPGDTKPTKSLPFSSAAQKALEKAWAESVENKQNLLTKECVFLGLLDQQDGLVFDVMKDLNADLAKMRQSLIAALKEVAEKAKSKQSSEWQTTLDETRRSAAYTRYPSTADFLRLFAIYWIMGIIGISCVLIAILVIVLLFLEHTRSHF